VVVHVVVVVVVVVVGIGVVEVTCGSLWDHKWCLQEPCF